MDNPFVLTNLSLWNFLLCAFRILSSGCLSYNLILFPLYDFQLRAIKRWTPAAIAFLTFALLKDTLHLPQETTAQATETDALFCWHFNNMPSKNSSFHGLFIFTTLLFPGLTFFGIVLILFNNTFWGKITISVGRPSAPLSPSTHPSYGYRNRPLFGDIVISTK